MPSSLKLRASPLLAYLILLAVPIGELAASTDSEPDETIARRVRAHAEFLAADDLLGRETGEAGYDIAARYVAAQLALLGIEPAGDDGSYFQAIPYRRSRIDPQSARVSFSAGGDSVDLVWADDFLMGGDPGRTAAEVTADAVFVGYGIVAPGLDHDDYSGVDVRGKIVVYFGGAPSRFPHNERAYYSSSRTKREEALRRGSVGVLGVQTRGRMERAPWTRMSRNAGRARLEWTAADGSIHDYDPRLEGSAALSPEAAGRLFELAGHSFAEAQADETEGRVESFELGVQVTLARETAHEDIAAPNVVGLWPGSDPELASEHVVFTAHLDHLGVGAPEGEDSIYNGLYDNAMGVAVLLEAARLFTQQTMRPARSVLFVAIGGEERGLLGSDYFARHPTVPGSLVANVNLDMPLFLYPLGDVVAFGAQHSSLAEPVAAAAEEVGWELSEDPMPEEVFFIRSDQYSFVRRGVPSVFLVSGTRSSDPEIDGASRMREFLATRYHTPTDQPGVTVHWPSAGRFTRLNYEIGRRVADAPEAPTWNDGDFFGELFAAGQ